MQIKLKALKFLYYDFKWFVLVYTLTMAFIMCGLHFDDGGGCPLVCYKSRTFDGCPWGRLRRVGLNVLQLPALPYVRRKWSRAHATNRALAVSSDSARYVGPVISKTENLSKLSGKLQCVLVSRHRKIVFFSPRDPSVLTWSIFPGLSLHSYKRALDLN